MNNTNEQQEKVSFLKIFTTFFSIGCFAFGGFMSLIAVVNSVVVEKKKWLKDEVVLDGISIANLLPGPMAVNVCTFLGYKMLGVRGALASFFGIITPSFVLIILFALNYELISQNNYINEFLFGIYPVLAAIIINAFLKLSKKIIQHNYQWLYILAPTLILLTIPKSLHLPTILTLMVSYGIWGYFSYKEKSESEISKKGLVSSGKNIIYFLLAIFAVFLIKYIPNLPLELELFSSFGSLSVLLFGGGYVFIPMLEDLVVNQQNWIGQKEFIDSIAIGQITPGPIVITVSYIGFKAAGLLGAIVSTLAIFGFPAILMVQVGKVFHLISANKKFKSAIKFLRFCGIGLILYAGLYLLYKTYTILPAPLEIRTALMLITFGASFFALRKWNTNIFIVILIGGIVQMLAYFLYLN